jgi:hypothetical protein
MDPQRIIAIVAGAICIIAILDLSYGFYMIVRCVATSTAIYLIITARVRLLDLQVFALTLVILIFNPIWKVHLGRDLWRIVDAVTGAFYFWTFATIKKKRTNRVQGRS